MYYRDANGTPVREDQLNPGMPVDTLGSYSRMLERSQKFPENRYREQLRREPGLDHQCQRLKR
jgi:hypothetical protein